MLKQLIPSHLAGVILGKGGETIVSIQSTTGSLIKMSKGSEYYPGIILFVCFLFRNWILSPPVAHVLLRREVDQR